MSPAAPVKGLDVNYKFSKSKYIPLNNLKSYTKCPSPVAAKYLLIVPPRNRMKTTVVAIQIGP
jgi:hypothetical protein